MGANFAPASIALLVARVCHDAGFFVLLLLVRLTGFLADQQRDEFGQGVAYLIDDFLNFGTRGVGPQQLNNAVDHRRRGG